MAGKISSPSSGGGSLLDDSGPISEINVTPFVDVVLVLLVIFMVTAPVLMKDAFGIKLPKAKSAEQKVKAAVLGIAISRQGQFLLNGQPVSEQELLTQAMQAVKADPEAQAIISADGEAKHADVVRAIDQVKSAGISQFALQIERSR